MDLGFESRTVEVARTSQAPMTVLPDFPRQLLGATSGVQPSVIGRLVGCRFVGGLTDEELYEHYDACVDLVMQVLIQRPRPPQPQAGGRQGFRR
jgi:hypothetical protein